MINESQASVSLDRSRINEILRLDLQPARMNFHDFFFSAVSLKLRLVEVGSTFRLPT